jgi:hypothetical protein
MAGLASGDLHRRQPGGLQAAGVVVGGQIAHDHRQAGGIEALGQGFQ